MVDGKFEGDLFPTELDRPTGKEAKDGFEYADIGSADFRCAAFILLAIVSEVSNGSFAFVQHDACGRIPVPI